MIQIKLYKINPTYIEEYKNWSAQIMNELYKEAQNSIAEEGCTLETFKIFPINETWFALGVMVADTGILKFKKSQNSEINVKHKIHNKNLFLEEIPLEDLYLIEKI
jgi:hypothetical protein